MDETLKAGLAGCVGAALVIAGYFFVAGGSVTIPFVNMPGSQSASPAQALAPHLDFGPNLDSSVCQGVGAPVVNIVEKIANDADSGTAGNYWALDTLNRTIEVWQTATAGTYCAVVRYEGSFSAFAGQTSPGGTGTLTGTERGTVTGGYQGTIKGALLAKAAWPTHGSVGPVDYQCTQQGSCPGSVNWLSQYFAAGYSFSQPWWGWIYRSGQKVWVNASTGTSGDI